MINNCSLTRPRVPRSSRAIPAFEPDAGLYLLCLKLLVPLSIRVGALGNIELKEGYYVYCGSARKNLSRRIRRHLEKEKKMRWHIDYLTSHQDAHIQAVNVFALKQSTECGKNLHVQHLPGAEPIMGFGCSDCSCNSHLTYFKRSPVRAMNRL